MHQCTGVSEEGGDGEAACSETLLIWGLLAVSLITMLVKRDVVIASAFLAGFQ